VAISEDTALDRWRLPDVLLSRFVEPPWWSPIVRTEPWKPLTVLGFVAAAAVVLPRPFVVGAGTIFALYVLWCRSMAARAIDRLTSSPDGSRLTLDDVGLHFEFGGVRQLIPRTRLTVWWRHRNLLLMRFENLLATHGLDTSSVDPAEFARIEELLRRPPPSVILPGGLVATWRPRVWHAERHEHEVRQLNGDTATSVIAVLVLALGVVLSCVAVLFDHLRGPALLVVAPIAICLLRNDLVSWIRLRRMDADQLRLGPEGLTVVAAGGSHVTTLAWSAIDRLKITRRLLLVTSLDLPRVLLLPLAALPDGTVERIQAAVETANDDPAP